jgi:methyltransferase-like protein
MTKSKLDRLSERSMVDQLAALAMQSIIKTEQGNNFIANDDFRPIALAAYAIACNMLNHRSELIKDGYL